MMRMMLRAVQAVLLMIFAAAPALAEKRVALVIGNAGYQHAGGLKNPQNDAGDVAKQLRRLDFDVMEQHDLTAEGFYRTFIRFQKKLKNADVGLLFYAGHGLQFGGVNYLVPVDARLANPATVRRESFALGDFIDLIENEARIGLVFLDACRDNPLAEQLQRSLKRSNRSGAVRRGLGALARQRNQTLIVYATAPDDVAADGAGRNSPFTGALLRHMSTPDVEIEVMLKRVTRSVIDATGALQRPERLSQLTSEFYFNRRHRREASLSPAALRQTLDTLQTRLNDASGKPSSAGGQAERGHLPALPPMVDLPGGGFEMGCVSGKHCRADELPVHRVILRPFAMSKTEITFNQWDDCVADKACPPVTDDEGWGRGERPVINVSWRDAVAYTRWLSHRTGETWRLPTEAEWEYAARAGRKTVYAFGDELAARHANFGDMIRRTKPVGRAPANRFGLHDMHGNVWEWVQDRYAADAYADRRLVNPKGPETGELRINRGGGWHYGALFQRAAIRVGQPADRKLSNVGFRVVKAK